MFQRLYSLLKLEMSQVFLYNVRHRHAQCSREILLRHHMLFF